MNYRQYKNILVEKYKCIFFIIPKNGCSSMKANIIEVLEMEKGADYPKDVHDPKIYPYPFVKTEDLNGAYQHHLRFCISRNPWDRLVSCFEDKIRSLSYNEQGYRNGVALPLLQNCPLFYGGMSFKEFVKVVCNIQDVLGEHHFTSQLYQITDDAGNLLTNYIGKLETLSEDLKEISLKSGFPTSEIQHLRRTKEKKYHEFYSDELKEKVRKRFAADIEFFKYTFNQDSNFAKIGYIDHQLKNGLWNSKWKELISKEKKRLSSDSLLQNQTEELKKELRDYENALMEIQNSISWRIAAPLRLIGSFFVKNRRK